MSTSTARRKLCEAGLYGRIVKKPKQCQKAPIAQSAQTIVCRAVELSPFDLQIKDQNLWVGEKAASSCITPTRRLWWCNG